MKQLEFMHVRGSESEEKEVCVGRRGVTFIWLCEIGN